VFFSDAVFAIAITLLVIDIRMPEGAAIADGHDLAAALWSLLPQFLGFLVSFVVIGSFWISHHRMFRLVRTMDGTLLFLDLLFLLFVAFIPFPSRHPRTVRLHSTVGSALRGMGGGRGLREARDLASRGASRAGDRRHQHSRGPADDGPQHPARGALRRVHPARVGALARAHRRVGLGTHGGEPCLSGAGVAGGLSEPSITRSRA